MAFIPVKRSVASFPISVLVYGDAGQTTSIDFTAQYRRHTKKELDLLSDGIANKIRADKGEELIKRGDGSTPMFEFETNTDFLTKIMVGWSGVVDENGQQRPFSEFTLREVLDDYPELEQPLLNGFWSAHRQAAQKN